MQMETVKLEQGEVFRVNKQKIKNQTGCWNSGGEVQLWTNGTMGENVMEVGFDGGWKLGTIKRKRSEHANQHANTYLL